jgi:hypothetical protein
VKLVSIEECEVTIALDVDELDLIAEGLRRAGRDAGTGERPQRYFWRALGLALSAASIPARMVADIPADRHPARYMESLERRMARLSGEEEPPAA